MTLGVAREARFHGSLINLSAHGVYVVSTCGIMEAVNELTDRQSWRGGLRVTLSNGMTVDKASAKLKASGAKKANGAKNVHDGRCAAVPPSSVSLSDQDTEDGADVVGAVARLYPSPRGLRGRRFNPRPPDK